MKHPRRPGLLRRSRTTAASAAAVVCLGLAGAAQEKPQPIRSGVELVSVDVQVVDRQGKPIAGLTPQDFEVTVGGRKRQVVSAQLVDYSSAAVATAAPGGPVTPGAAPAAERPRRQYVIGVDEHSIRFGSSRAAMEAATRFIKTLNADDLVGLAAYPNGAAYVELTTDHAKVLAGLAKVRALFEIPKSKYNISPSEAIDIASRSPFTGNEVIKRECPPTDRTCPNDLMMAAQAMAMTYESTLTQSLGGLRALIDGLGKIPGRKVLVVVSGGLLMNDQGGGRADEGGRVMDVGQLAARTNTTLYALHMDTRFLDAFAEQKLSNTMLRDENMFARGLEMIAGAAGGTVFRVQTGSGDPAFQRVLLETSAQYLLGVDVRPEDRDGKEQPIRVQVKAKNASVRSRSFVTIPKAGTH